MDVLAALDAQLSQVMKSNAQLRASNQALRSANAEGLGDVNLVNAAMQAEIDTLTAERAAEAAQLEILLKALTQTSEEPQLQKARDALDAEASTLLAQSGRVPEAQVLLM